MCVVMSVVVVESGLMWLSGHLSSLALIFSPNLFDRSPPPSVMGEEETICHTIITIKKYQNREKKNCIEKFLFCCSGIKHL